MPKNKSKTKVEEDEYDRRPQNITLGCFIKEAKPRGKKKSVENECTIGDASTVEDAGLTASSVSLESKAAIQADDGKPGLAVRHKTITEDYDEIGSCFSDHERECRQECIQVMRTKKGGFPIYLEKRAKGKKVTVIRQVTGDSKLLLQTLKAKFGTGGLIKPGEVEIQGDFEDKLVKYFRENSHLLVQYKSGS